MLFGGSRTQSLDIFGHLFCRDDRLVGCHRVVDARIRDKVRLELGQVDVESTIEPEEVKDLIEIYKHQLFLKHRCS